MDRRQPIPTSSRMSVETLISGIPIDERRSPTVQARSTIKVTGNFGDVKWTLRVEPRATLGILLKHWREWSAATRHQLQAAIEGHRAAPQRAVVEKFLRRQLNIVYRFLRQREANDDLAALLDRFRPADRPGKERHRKLQWAANLVHAAYPEQWSAANWPRTIPNPETVLRSRLGSRKGDTYRLPSLRTRITRPEFRVVTRAIGRSIPSEPLRCPRCRCILTLEEAARHLASCAADLVKIQPDVVARHWTRREEVARLRLLRKAR
jgi:hypothetical protein